MDKCNEFLKKAKKFDWLREKLVCADGFSISVQASRGHYCSPRVDAADVYETVECGFPNQEEPLILEYAEEPDRPTDTVYGYVPVEVMDAVIEKHGGVYYGQ